MQCDEKINNGDWGKLGLLVFQKGVINERFVAASTVMEIGRRTLVWHSVSDHQTLTSFANSGWVKGACAANRQTDAYVIR